MMLHECECAADRGAVYKALYLHNVWNTPLRSQVATPVKPNNERGQNGNGNGLYLCKVLGQLVERKRKGTNSPGFPFEITFAGMITIQRVQYKEYNTKSTIQRVQYKEYNTKTTIQRV